MGQTVGVQQTFHEKRKVFFITVHLKQKNTWDICLALLVEELKEQQNVVQINKGSEFLPFNLLFKLEH